MRRSSPSVQSCVRRCLFSSYHNTASSMAHPPTSATASSSSASPRLAGVIGALSKISADGLTILILQQPTVGRAICQALRCLAKQALADVVVNDDEDAKASRLPAATFAQILDILKEAVSGHCPSICPARLAR